MMIAQLTDTHLLSLRSAQPLACRRAEDLRRCVADINRLNPLPDAVIHTGDLTHEGDPEAYALARDIVSELVPPFYPIPGNCDNRVALADTFGDAVLMPMHGAFVQYAVDEFPLRLVGLDTQGTIGHDGDYDDERMGELRGATRHRAGESQRRYSCTIRRLLWERNLPRFECALPLSVWHGRLRCIRR